MVVGVILYGLNIKYFLFIKVFFIGVFFLLCFEIIRNIFLLLKFVERLNNDLNLINLFNFIYVEELL